MDYFKILKKAFEIALKNKYLWFFAIFAGGVGSSFNSSFSNSISYTDKWDQYLNQARWENFWTSFGGLIMIILGLLIIFGIAGIIFSIISQGAILGSVRAIEENQKHNFWMGVAFGWHKFWRVFGVGIIMFLAILFSLIVLVVPIVLFILAKIYIAAVIFGIFCLVLDLILWFYLGVMFPYIQRLAVLDNHGSWKAFLSSWQFFKTHWKVILITYLILIAVGLATVMAFFLIILIIGGLLFIIGFALYLASMAAFWMYVAVFGCAFLLLLLILGAAINTFRSAILTLVYLEIAPKNA